MANAAYDTPKRHEFKAEDRDRISRLMEEIRGRLEELALISARSAGFPLTNDVVRKFAPRGPVVRGSPYHVEIVCPPPDVGPCGCIVLMDDGNHFFEQPCGSGG